MVNTLNIATKAFELSVPAGITALIGPSGAGKTSLAKAVCGIYQSENPISISLSGKDLSAISTHERGIALVPQDNALFPHLSVAGNINFAGKADASQIELLELGGLLDRMPDQISGGEAKRVAILRALAANPSVLILDEPTAGLDPKKRKAFCQMIYRLVQSCEIPTLYITHDINEMMMVAENAALMLDERLVCQGNLEDVIAAPETSLALGLDDAGSLIHGQVISSNDGLLEIQAGETVFYAQGNAEKNGQMVRLRIMARDVALASKKPENTSILNMLELQIISANEQGNDVIYTCASTDNHFQLRSRITKHSHQQLGLGAGDTCYGLIKAVAVQETVSPNTP